ncbi:MAG TPA: hypothetical protein VGP89_06670 [Candidatus Angelobacter sp.]|nr:hypothetical protein [Candidatus Angelobacter sp.]
MKIQLITKPMLLALVAIMLLAMPCAVAQSAAQTKSSRADDQKESTDSDSVSDQPWYANSQGAYTVSLGTGQLISLYPQPRNDQTIPTGEYVEGQQSISLKSKDYKYQMFYGLSASSIYTNSIGGLGTGSDLVSTSINPYLALFVPTRTGRFLLQYSTVVNPNDTQSGGPQSYHTLSVSGMGSITQRLYWTASSSGSYGSESARLQGPLSFLVVQSTPIADTTSTAVLLQAKNVAFAENSFGLGWLKSRRDKISLTAFHVYTGIEGDPTTPQSLGSHANAVGGKLEYVRTLTPRIDLRSYGQTESVLNGPTCNTYGGGLGIGVRMTHSISFDVQGGPQWSTSTCGSPQSANFSASLVKNFGNQDKIYASVNRMFTTIARLNSRWEDNATVGFAKGFHRLTFTTDAGYLRGDSITTVVPAYHGYFVAPRVRYKITNTMGLSGGYRSFHGAGGNLVSGNLSYAVVGIEWYPAPLHLR